MYYIFSGNTGGPSAFIGDTRGAEGFAKQEAKRLMGIYVHENHLNPQQAEQVRRLHSELCNPESPCLCVVCNPRES